MADAAEQVAGHGATITDEGIAKIRKRIGQGFPGRRPWRTEASADAINHLAYAIGDQGMLFAHGDQGGGYAMYVEDGRLRFVHNGYGTMTEVDCGELGAGTDEIVLDMENEGSLRWNARILVGGEQVGEALGLAVLMAMAPFEGIDVGIDRRSPVSWDVYERHGPYPYTGELTAVTYVPGPLAPDAGERFLDYLKEAGTRYE